MEKNKKMSAARRSMAVILAFAFAAFAKSAAAALPDALDEWRGTSAQVTEFTLTKDAENLGQWQRRIYIRDAPAASVEANLMEGPGTGTLFVPEGVPDGEIGPSSAYETLNIAGKRAILERGEVTGHALAVALGEHRTLTLETKSLTREELLEFTQRLIATLER